MSDDTAPSVPRAPIRSLWALVVGRFTLATGFALAYPFIAIYLKQQRHLSAAIVGAIFAASGIAVCLGMLAGGELSDRLGSRRVMLTSLFARIGFALLYSVCILREVSIPLFALVHVLNSLLFGLYEPASQALVTDLTSERERVEGFSLLRMGGNLGWAIGPMLGGLVPPARFHLLFDGSAVAYLISATLTLLWVPSPKAARPRSPWRESEMDGRGGLVAAVRSMVRALREALAHVCGDRRFVVVGLLGILVSMTMAQLVVGMSLYCTQERRMEMQRIGWLLTVNGGVVVLLQYPVMRLLGRARLTTSLAFGSLVYAIAYVWVGSAGPYRELVAAMVLVTIAEIVVSPTMDALAANLSPAAYRGRYRGVFSLALQFGRVLGVTMSGIVLSRLMGMRLLQWEFLAVPAALAAVGYVVLRWHLTPAEEAGLELQLQLPTPRNSNSKAL